MKPPDPNESGGPVFRTAARMITPVAKPKADAVGELVNFLRQRARHYFTRYQTTGSQRDIRASDPVEHQRLGIWLQRMRRAIS